MVNFTFYDKPINSVQTTKEGVIKNTLLILVIISVFCSIIIYLGYKDFQKNKLLNKQTIGNITQGKCNTELNRVSNGGRKGMRTTTTCVVNYKYKVDNKELDGVYTGGIFTETEVGKEVTIYYNDKKPSYSSMKKNIFTGLFVMLFGVAFFGLVAYSLFFNKIGN